MGDLYQYPVFFECPSLDGEQRKRIENYFHIRRKSGGGDCGSVKKINDKVYSIGFRERDAQQRVLQRSEHILQFADGPLVLTVRDSSGPTSKSVSPKLDLTSSQTQQSILASSLLTTGEEYEKQLDSYLLRYLKEHPNAETELQKELASVACSAQLYPEEERVLVRRLAQPDAVDEGRNWRVQVDKLFDGYLCHYEIDPHKIKALLQSCSSQQTTDEVKVYSEIGMAIVVGRCSQVNARLMDVEESHVKRGLSEKQITNCRLGEAKLRLLWKEIEHSLARDFPGVKVTQGDSGQLVLEGSVEEILKAGHLVSDKERLVLERKVSGMSPHLLAFLRKAYGGPGVLGDFLGVSDTVEIELRDTELRFLTLSADNLDEAERALRAKIKELKMDVPEVRNRLGPFLDSLVQDRITTEPLEEVRCFKEATGRDEQNLASLTEVNPTVASYSLCNGVQVLVCHGDITKQDADALVNAANEDLDHCGGVAAALSKAGGPEVQRESNVLVERFGKIPTGDVVVTTGGNLNCKKLLHAVGPVGGRAGGKERVLLEKTVQSALNFAEIMEFQSIALPCISSGVFGVPVTVCSEAIVTAVKKFGSQGGRSLSRIILIDNRKEVVRAMQETCDRLLQGINTGNSAPYDLGFEVDVACCDPATGATAGAPGDEVHLEIIEGTIETQQVDALVSPMVGTEPLSTRVGNTLSEMAGSQLTARFRKETREEIAPGDAVLVEGLYGPVSNAVFFLDLVPWDDDEDGTAVQVLRLGINQILITCEKRGFASVAFPVLGVGIALRFPHSVAARVLQEEIHAFKENRDSRTPLLIRIVIYPNDEESSEAFRCAPEPFHLERFTKDVHHPEQVSSTKRIVLLGKTGSGKSNLANTIFGENLFAINHSPNSGTNVCQAETRSVDGRSLTLIDTPGFFDAVRSEEDLKPEIVRCITECAPGPHAFLIVLKVEKFTEHEQAVITKICQYFSEDALKYAVIVFTHGDQLPKGMKIEEFVSQNKNLSDLVKKCGGRCHVIDNKYWKNQVPNNYKSNHFQVEDLLNTIDKMVMENKGGYYINNMLQEVEKEIQREEEQMKQSSGNMPVEEIRKRAKSRVSERFLIQLAGTATGVLFGAFFGVAAMVGLVITALHNSTLMKIMKSIPAVRGAAAVVGTEAGLIGAGVVAGVTTAGLVAAGGVVGGIIGHDAAEGAETAWEAAERAAKAVIDKGKDTLKL